MAASASEIARQDEAISARFGEGFERSVEAIQHMLEVQAPAPSESAEASTADARERALAIAAAMIGGITVARAVHKARPELSDEIVTAVRHVLGAVGGEDMTAGAHVPVNKQE